VCASFRCVRRFEMNAAESVLYTLLRFGVDTAESVLSTVLLFEFTFINCTRDDNGHGPSFTCGGAD
jgi:hypothetical protein